jgi:DNA-binding CsgD family transcriptional regulator
VPITISWQQDFLEVLPAIQTHAKICFRKLGADRREEAIRATIATACVNYQLAAAQGKLNVVRPGSLADFAVKHVRAGRHVGGHQDGARDVMSPVCQRRHDVEVVSYDRDRFPASLRNGTDGWRQLVLADRKVPVPDLAAFRVDFGQWFQMRSRRDQSIISSLIAGESPSAVADRFGISRGRVSQLRRRYEREWRGFQGETSEEAA